MENTTNPTMEDMICYSAHMITTNGIWQGDNPLEYSLPLFILQVILVVVATRIFDFILKPIHQPRVIAEIMGGIVLGPSVLGRSKTFANAVFPLRSVIVIETMGNVGLLYFIFLVGVGIDGSAIRRTGKKAVAVAVVGMVLPFAIGALYSVLFITVPGTSKGATALFLGVVLSVSAFPVLARILAELKLINTEMGKVALSSALINDVCSWMLLAIAISIAEDEKPSLGSLMVILASAAFVALYVYAVRPIISWIIRNTPEGEPFSDFYISLILAGVMISGFITDAIGIHSVFGAFVFGLIIPNGPLGFTLIEKLEDFVSGLLLPLFFAISGLKTNISLIRGFSTWVILFLLVILACIGKIAGTLIVTFTYQMSLSEGAVLGFLMNTKGLVEIILLNIGKDQKVLDDHVFSTMVIITLLMTGVIVPAISIIYKPSRGFISYKRRTIQMSKRDSEFRVLVCLHTPRNVPTMINLLEASNPTKKSPICIYVLNLVELTGRSSAMLVFNNASTSNHPTLNRNQAQCDHIINAFENYEQHADSVSVQPLTAISPYSTMHEDICSLAEEKRVAFIIIPFHKQQTVDGGMETINSAFRSINQHVLENSPCSVGILVDRGLNGSNRMTIDQVSYHVAVLFFGGPDDREALSYGWRMSEHPGICLTVMRFIKGKKLKNPSHNPDEPNVLTVETDKDTENQLDEKFIHWFMMSHENNDSIVYNEKEVNNGEETVAAIRSMDGSHGLFLIGRGQGMTSPLTAGLTDWSECPELGAIGDLLASSDFAASASVLVVQQYIGAGSEGDGLGTPNSSIMTNEEHVKQKSQHHPTLPRGHSMFHKESP